MKRKIILLLAITGSVLSYAKDDTTLINKAKVRYGFTWNISPPSEISFAIDSSGFQYSYIDNDYKATKTGIAIPSKYKLYSDYTFNFEADILVPIGKELNIFFMGFTTITANETSMKFIDIEKGTTEIDGRLNTRFYGGGILTGIHKIIGFESFGLETKVGCGISSFGRELEFTIQTNENQGNWTYNDEVEVLRTASFTNFTSYFSMGIYFKIKNLTISPAYRIISSSKQGVGVVLLNGVGLSIGFENGT